jgi:pyruvate,water dikinase
VRHIEKLIDWNTRCFQLHLKCTRYAIGAYGLLTYMLCHWLPAGGVELGSDLLVSQAELQTAEQGLALWQLAEQARAHPSVAAVLGKEEEWTAAQRALQATKEGQAFLGALAAFLTKHGARAVEEFELASPRWREDPTFVLTVIRNYLHADAALDPATGLSQHRAPSDVAMNHVTRQMGPLKGWLFRRVLHAYKAYVPLRENMKYRLMEGYEALRHCFLLLGDRLCTAGALDSREDIFFLTAGEVLAAVRDGAIDAGEIRAKVNRRRAERACQEQFQPPEMIVGDDWSRALNDNDMETLQGIGCSPGYAVGKARVIRDIAMASHFQPGEILVAPSTDPGWTPLFLTAAAVVTDIGGFLSHGATVAREYGIPAVVNTKRASELVKNGQVIIVDGNQGIVHLPPQNLSRSKVEELAPPGAAPFGTWACLTPQKLDY